MKKRHVYLVASAVNLLGMGIMMVSGAHVLGLIVGAVILSLRRRPTHGYLFLDAGRPRWITACGKPGLIPQGS
ncbi:sugar transporter glycoside-pentoside-hexuronide (GPH):cation symporter family [Klebsiella pneumoniae]|uniref:Sugar transporter glycoside-pentoside-hexuronide (GPH):cation symporter family n=1 Tax=Klebsiella pneumoniae TaxID=573 RepID=A0A2X3H3A2_KLEPN|nr:sugar transporter glycoside-pentoside-hexuronide (GPH):cation symporter family [Klebsiella pneumoniae]